MSKILLCNRNEQGHLGGDSIQLRAYQKALQSLGHQVEYSHGRYYADPNEYRYYDEMWGFHTNFDWAYWPYLKAKAAKIPFRLISIFYKGVYVNINKEQMKEMADYAVGIYCLSEKEKEEMIAELELSSETASKMVVIPNGVDSSIFNKSGPKINEPTNYVISVGRFAQDKGLHHVVNACKKANLSVVIIGARWDAEYADQLRRLWDKAYIIDQLPQSTLAEYLRSANTYVCAAENERNNLSLIEAIACGVKSISSPGNRGNQWFPNIPIVDPKDEDQLAEVIRLIYNTDNTQEFTTYDWKDVVKKII